MAEVIKILGQAAPAATTEVDLYTVPNLKAAVISSIVVCNRGAATSFRIAVCDGGGVTANQHYQYYDTAIGANDTFKTTIGITLSNTDKIKVYSTSGNVSFSCYGSEIDQANV